MSLKKYRAKRNFSKTNEPAANAPIRKRAKDLRFVVQKHAASRLHYDFRLELDGVLKSWAVPKGPSLNPQDKRLAVHVEDHPIEYANFEGVIPPNQYGSGPVIVWDRGEWEPLGDPHKDYEKGSLKFTLRGEKLAGNWALVRIKNNKFDDRQDSWLLIKEKDGQAKPGAKISIVEQKPLSVISGLPIEKMASSTEKKAGEYDFAVKAASRKVGKPKLRPTKKPSTRAKKSAPRGTSSRRARAKRK